MPPRPSLKPRLPLKQRYTKPPIDVRRPAIDTPQTSKQTVRNLLRGIGLSFAAEIPELLIFGFVVAVVSIPQFYLSQTEWYKERAEAVKKSKVW